MDELTRALSSLYDAVASARTSHYHDGLEEWELFVIKRRVDDLAKALRKHRSP